MEYTIPDYYKEFQCTANECEDTCCAGWQIAVDERSMARYRRVRGPYRFKLLSSIHWLQSTFRQSPDLRCAFLNPDNYCDMYAHLGPKSLCKTCRLYPRHIEEFEEVREITLSISCPEVCRILLTRNTPVTFKTYNKEGTEEYEEFDPFLYSQLLDARDVMYDIIYNQKLSIPTIMHLLQNMGNELQAKVDSQNLFACSDVLERYESLEMHSIIEALESNKTMDQKKAYAIHCFKALIPMERLRPNWSTVLKEAKSRLYDGKIPANSLQKDCNPTNNWTSITEDFEAYMASSALPWDLQKRHLLVYFISTYFCGATYDGRIRQRINLAVTSVIILEELLKSTWLRNECKLDLDDIIEIVYRYSREIEHSDKNLEILIHYQ